MLTAFHILSYLILITTLTIPMTWMPKLGLRAVRYLAKGYIGTSTDGCLFPLIHLLTTICQVPSLHQALRSKTLCSLCPHGS